MGKELSIFIDESGKFGDYKSRTDFYVIGFIFHDQDYNIKNQTEWLENSVENLGFLKKLHIHTGPFMKKKF